MKLPAIGRKNYLFVGSQRGGHGAAVMYSLVSSAKANGVEPFAWLRDLFAQLPYRRSSEAFAQSRAGEAVTSCELDDLLPDRWLQAHPNCDWAIDHLRRVERQRQQPRHRPRRRNR